MDDILILMFILLARGRNRCSVSRSPGFGLGARLPHRWSHDQPAIGMA